MNRIINFRGILSEEAQATAEYTLVVFGVTLALIFVIKNLVRPVFAQMSTFVVNQVQSQLFGVNLHVFKVR